MTQPSKTESEAPTPADTREQQFHAIIALQNRVAELEGVLRQIAVGKRADGTYNRSREACEQMARVVLGGDL